MWEQLLMFAVFAATLGVAILVNLRLRSQVSNVQMALDGKDREIQLLKDSHLRELKNKAAENDELLSDLREARNVTFKLQTVAEAKRRYDYCHRCEQPKGSSQQQSGNGQRARGNARVHAIVSGEE